MEGLRELRRKKFLTQKELASAVGVRYQTVLQWEKGENVPRLSAMRKLCEVLEVTPDQLLAALKESQWAHAQREGQAQTAASS